MVQGSVGRVFAAALVVAGAASACAPPTPDEGAGPARSSAIFGGTVDTTRPAVMALLHWKTPTTPFACSGTARNTAADRPVAAA